MRRMSSEYIPVEIQTEILKRLPVKPLIRFRSVSKPWKCFIDSPDFIVSYGVRHPQRPDCFILGCNTDLVVGSEDNDHSFVQQRFCSEYENKYFMYFDGDHSFVQQGFCNEDLCVPDLLSRYNDYPCVVGSSHGLLCFHIIYHESMSDSLSPLSREMVVVWNPSIRKSVCIPVPYIYHDFPDEGYGVYNAIGFGVCPLTFDPIILKMKWISGRGNRISRPWRVRVFTLSTGTWNILSTNLPRDSVTLRGPQVVVDRFIYWVAFDTLAAQKGRSESPFLIMSFDLTTKEFKEINLTGSLSKRLSSIETISKLHESLVLLEYHREFEEDISVWESLGMLEFRREFEEDNSVCSLWMMTNELGVNRSFTKLYNINVPHATVKRLLGFRKTGELIVVTKHRRCLDELVTYDPNSEAINSLRICGVDSSFFMCSYLESLLLFDQLDGFIYSIGN